MKNRQPITRENLVSVLEKIYLSKGRDEYLGEPVTVAQHMLQGATIAEQTGQDEHIIVAALLHDVGHFVGEFGTFSMDDTQDRYHEESGAKMLEPFFPKVVVDCVRHHVAAKRYLCATRREYLSRLSKASVHSLKLQGGPMNEEEVAQFEKLPNLRAIVQVRYLDDGGKQANMQTAPFSHFAPMLERLIDAHHRQPESDRQMP